MFWNRLNGVVDKIDERKSELDAAVTEIEKTLTTEEIKTAFQEFTAARKTYDRELDGYHYGRHY
ncbi:MAG: hypothetical protein KBG63_06790 [Acetobacterium sp.]|nr:hypothetical protein [Acetobacterium sp.]